MGIGINEILVLGFVLLAAATPIAIVVGVILWVVNSNKQRDV